jgi:hypothetical protein
MFMTCCRVTTFAALAFACLLAACDGAPNDSQTAPQPKPNAPAPKVARLSNQMVSAVSAGKTASAISVHFALGAAPVVGQALPVKIAIVPHRSFKAVQAHFESHDGLTVTAGENFGPITEADSETALEHDLVLLPAKEGVFMVTTSVAADDEDGSVTRIYTIPVIVGPAVGVTTAPGPADAGSAAPKPAAN